MAELIAEIGKRHSQLGRLRLVVTRVGENNLMTLKAECGSPSHPLRDQVAAARRTVAKLGGNASCLTPARDRLTAR